MHSYLNVFSDLLRLLALQCARQRESSFHDDRFLLQSAAGDYVFHAFEVGIELEMDADGAG